MKNNTVLVEFQIFLQDMDRFLIHDPLILPQEMSQPITSFKNLCSFTALYSHYYCKLSEHYLLFLGDFISIIKFCN